MGSESQDTLDALLVAVRACRACEAQLPFGPRPVLQMGAAARILIVGQAPGARVHASGIPWDDRSGDRLRAWMGIDAADFYNPQQVALVPMGLCYPGRGASGDLPPIKACAALWHERLFAQLPQLELTLLVGQYAQAWWLRGRGRAHLSVTETTRDWRSLAPDLVPLPHPSPRNVAWFKANPWFGEELVPALQARLRHILRKSAALARP